MAFGDLNGNYYLELVQRRVLGLESGKSAWNWCRGGFGALWRGPKARPHTVGAGFRALKGMDYLELV